MILALNNGVNEISITVATNLRGSNRNHCPMSEKTFDHGSSMFYHLQSLWLEKVYLSEKIVRDIVRNCPNIKDLSLRNFCGLKALKIAELDKLERLGAGNSRSEHEIERVDVDSPSLKCFDFISNGPKLPCRINLTSCYDLKELHLTQCSITDDLLSVYFSRFPFLEDLAMFECHMLRTVSAQRLRSLRFVWCDEIKMIQVDALSLSKFEHKGFTCLS